MKTNESTTGVGSAEEQNEQLRPTAVSGSAFSPYDLRHGNLVNYTTAEGDTIPSLLDWQDLKWLTENPEGFNSVHTKIDLDDEWLTKFGFKKIDHHRYMKGSSPEYNYYYTYSMHDFAFRFYVGDTIVCITTLFFVHQLQNLWYDISHGEQLS